MYQGGSLVPAVYFCKVVIYEECSGIIVTLGFKKEATLLNISFEVHVCNNLMLVYYSPSQLYFHNILNFVRFMKITSHEK